MHVLWSGFTIAICSCPWQTCPELHHRRLSHLHVHAAQRDCSRASSFLLASMTAGKKGNASLALPYPALTVLSFMRCCHKLMCHAADSCGNGSHENVHAAFGIFISALWSTWIVCHTAYVSMLFPLSSCQTWVSWPTTLSCLQRAWILSRRAHRPRAAEGSARKDSAIWISLQAGCKSQMLLRRRKRMTRSRSPVMHILSAVDF